MKDKPAVVIDTELVPIGCISCGGFGGHRNWCLCKDAPTHLPKNNPMNVKTDNSAVIANLQETNDFLRKENNDLIFEKSKAVDENLKLKEKVEVYQRRIETYEEMIKELLMFTEKDGLVVNGFRVSDIMKELSKLFKSNKQ